MNTIVDKLNGIKDSKEAIRQSIINKGVFIDKTIPFDLYAAKINEIKTPDSLKNTVPNISIYSERKFGSIKNNRWLFDQIKTIDWSEYNSLGITDMSDMFNSWSGKSLDVLNLNTSGVTSMDRMFSNCSNILSLDLSSFDTKDVVSMDFMFLGCNNLSDLILGSSWASNNNMRNFDISSCPLSHKSILHIFNRLAFRRNFPIITISKDIYDTLSQAEILSVADKGWILNRNN